MDFWLFFFATLFGWLALMSVWMTRLNESLVLFDPIGYIPLVQSNFIIWSIIGGGIFFQDFNGMRVFPADSKPGWCGFAMGVFIIFSGIYLLSPVEYKEEGSEHIDEEDPNRLSLDIRKSLSEGPPVIDEETE